MEEWRDVVGFEAYYQVSNLGNVRSKDRVYDRPKGHTGRKVNKGRQLKLQTSWDGYHYVALWVSNKMKRARVNRLVAMAFIPNPLSLPCVNHINEIRDDNRVENLEWCTYRQNTSHRNCIRKFVHGKKRPIVAIDESGRKLWFESAQDAAEYGFSESSIRHCLAGRMKKHKGMTWQKV